MGWLSNIPFLKKLFENDDIFHREVRVGLYHSEVYFRPEHSGSERLLNVINISMGGMALEKSPAIFWPPKDEKFVGKLYLNDMSFDITNRLVHIGAGIVGCEFIDVPKGFHARLKDFLKIEFSARALIRIQDDVLKHDIEGTPYYFYARTGDEAYFVTKSNEIEFASFIIDKQFISIGKNQPLKTGEVVKDINDSLHGYKRIDSIAWSASPSKELLVKAIRFVDNIELMKPEHRDLLVKTLKDYKQY